MGNNDTGQHHRGPTGMATCTSKHQHQRVEKQNTSPAFGRLVHLSAPDD